MANNYDLGAEIVHRQYDGGNGYIYRVRDIWVDGRYVRSECSDDCGQWHPYPEGGIPPFAWKKAE